MKKLKKWSNEDIASKVESEGLGYLVTDYLSAESIEDVKLKELWKQASEALNQIEKTLKPYMS